jgi:hypothetical protein
MLCGMCTIRTCSARLKPRTTLDLEKPEQMIHYRVCPLVADVINSNGFWGDCFEDTD